MSADNERLNHLLGQARYAEAERYARECIGKSPHWGAAYTQLARALAGLGQHREAVEAAREGVRKSPHDSWALAILGYAFKHAGQLPEAAESLYDAARTDPSYTWTYCMLAEVELDRGRTKEAYEATLTGVRYDPTAENLLRWKGWCEYQLDQIDDAVRTAEAGLAVHPNSPLLRNVLGCVRWHQAEQTSRPWRKIRHHAQAHDYLLEAVRLNPSEDVYRNNLARNARICRKYTAERLMLLFIGIPLLAFALVVILFGREYSQVLAVPVVVSVAFVVKVGQSDDLLRVAPLGWLGVPTPPLSREEQERGRWKFRLFAIGYVLWLASIVLVLGSAGTFG